MNKFLIFMSMLVGIIIFIVFISAIGNPDTKKASQNEAKWALNKATLGEKYPYTIDDLILRCEFTNQNDKTLALWLEDSEGNKYGLNGNAQTKFLNDKKYKGYSDLILKENKSDLYSGKEAENICLKTGE